MAESAVEFLIENILTLIKDEASLLGGLSHELEEIKQELESMRSFLKVADKITRTKNTSEEAKTWVKQVREVAYDIEDTIDEFMYHLGSKRSTSSSGFKGCFHNTIHLPKDLITRHKIATKLQQMKAQVQAISERHQRYVTIDHAQINEGTSNPHCGTDRVQYIRDQASYFIEDDDVVGLDKDKEKLLGWLVESECQRSVIALVGMGGSGKTTLAAKVYKSKEVKRYFDCYAWITVSQTYVIEELFRSMVKELFKCKEERVPVDLSTMNCKCLVQTIVDYLQQKRYLIVLDDVWETISWKEISLPLINGGIGSRVMLTTRNEEVANSSFGVKSYVHRLLPLKEKDAWNLFCRKAMPYDPINLDHQCPPELKEVVLLILKKCKGLPLAIVAMGGLVSSKCMTYIEWMKVYESLNWELSNNPELEVVKGILFLSYNDLPHYLKHCFRYCCLFPEDFPIRRKRLIRLWVAEGFVGERKGKQSMEEVADTYLMQLISRNMLQVVERNSYGRPKVCQMHDLMRELALSVSQEENFCTIYDESSTKDRISPRRLSIHGGIDVSINQSCANIVQLRSLLMFSGKLDGSSSQTPSAGSLFPLGSNLLRVVDMQGLPIKSVPDGLVKMFNLRYLNLRKTQVKELPNSIGQLRNLQTLDTRDSQIKALPDSIVKCKNLRHVIMYRYTSSSFSSYTYVKGNKVPKDIWKLKNLQVLACIQNEENMIKQLGSMTQLRRIGITKIKEADKIDLCNTIEKLKQLRYLFVMASDEEEWLRMDALSSAPPLLQTLIMVGKLEKIPLWFGSLTNLSNLYLHWSRLSEDPFPHLHGLSGLTRLSLINAYDGQHLCIRNGLFPKLKQLYLGALSSLNDIVIEKGAVPDLETLTLSSCKELKMVPLGIEYLANLQILHLQELCDELLIRLRGENSIDRPRVQHIPKIDNYYLTYSGWKYESLSSSSIF